MIDTTDIAFDVGDRNMDPKQTFAASFPDREQAIHGGEVNHPGSYVSVHRRLITTSSARSFLIRA